MQKINLKGLIIKKQKDYQLIVKKEILKKMWIKMIHVNKFLLKLKSRN